MTTNSQNPVDSTLLFNGITPLPDWGLILIEGPDAATLLQSQLSNSVLGLKKVNVGEIAQGSEATRLAGYCNPKGRLIASAWLALYAEGENLPERFALFISKDIAASTAKKLSMYILRSKVIVINASESWEVFGAYSGSNEGILKNIAKNNLAMEIPSVANDGKLLHRALIAKPKIEGGYSTLNFASLERWNSLEVLSGIPRIVLATQEQFVPQMINFESVLGVDFKKGCYPGQEIVARSQYRGAVKRRLQLAHTSANPTTISKAKPGVEIYHSSDASQPCGMIVLASPNPGNPDRIDLQLECKLDCLESGSIHLGNSGGPVLQIDSLPYPLIEI